MRFIPKTRPRVDFSVSGNGVRNPLTNDYEKLEETFNYDEVRKLFGDVWE